MRLAFVVLSCLCFLSACKPSSLKVGVALPLSGSAAARGQSMLNAILLAVDEINQSERLKGQKLEILVHDDRDLPLEGEQVAQRLIDAGAIAVIGHYSSDVTLHTLPQYQAAQVALISPAVTLSHVPLAGKIFFRTAGSNRLQAQAAVDFIQQAQFREIVLVHNKSLYAQDLARELSSQMKKRLKFEPLIQSENAQTPELLSQLEPRPELVYYAGGYRNAALFLQQLREVGVQADFMGDNTLLDSEFVRLTGLRHMSKVWLSGLMLPSEPTSESHFINRYRNRFGAPDVFAAAAYDAVYLLEQALLQAKKQTAQGVLEALASTSDYTGVNGRIDPAVGVLERFQIFSVNERGEFQGLKALSLRGVEPGLLLGSAAASAKPQAE